MAASARASASSGGSWYCIAASTLCSDRSMSCRRPDVSARSACRCVTQKHHDAAFFPVRLLPTLLRQSCPSRVHCAAAGRAMLIDAVRWLLHCPVAAPRVSDRVSYVAPDICAMHVLLATRTPVLLDSELRQADKLS